MVKRYRHFIKKDITLINEHMKICSKSLAIGEMQIKTTLRHHYIPVRMTKIRNSENTSASKDAEKLELPYISGDSKKWYIYFF